MPRLMKSTRQHGRSMFFQLLTSFGAIVLLLISFNFVSYMFFRTNIQNEIINNSQTNMQATVDKYEKQLTLVRNFGFSMLFSGDTDMLTNEVSAVNFEWASELRKDIQAVLSNSFLNLANIIYYTVDAGFILEKDGSTSADLMFDKFYASGPYPASFWEKEVRKPGGFTVLPATSFREVSIEAEKDKGLLFPIVIKNMNDRSVVLILMMDARQLFDGFHQMRDRNFHIVDSGGKMLFASVPSPDDSGLWELLPAMSAEKGYIQKGSDYYFYQKGRESGFFYISVVPNEKITDQITGLNLLLALILLVSAGISFVASIWFSYKLNNPIARIVQSISQQNFSATPRTRIREIDLIHEKVGDLLQQHRSLNEDITQKNSLLTTYAYTSRLKKIHLGTGHYDLPVMVDKPFRLVLFQLHFKNRFNSEMGKELQRASYFIREYIQSHLANYYSDTLTFQLEKDQILSLLFSDGHQNQELALMDEILHQLKRVLDLDRTYYLVTIAFSPLNPESVDFNAAYELVTELVKQRRLGDDTQIIANPVPAPSLWLMSPSEEDEFQVHLAAGNEQLTYALVKRLLHSLHRKHATLMQVREFAEEAVRKTVKMLTALKLSEMGSEDETLEESLAVKLADCYTLEQFEEILGGFLAGACDSIKRKKGEKDPITRFVFDYVAEHYGEEFSLEQVAERMSLTPAYLSTTFKEKTGVNFSEYVNQYRIRIAKERLENSDLKIQEVAAMVGYQNVNSFIRMFKKITGVPPGEFRKSKQLT